MPFYTVHVKFNLILHEACITKPRMLRRLSGLPARTVLSALSTVQLEVSGRNRIVETATTKRADEDCELDFEWLLGHALRETSHDVIWLIYIMLCLA